MKTHYSSARLLLDELRLSDHDFIFELVNTEEWIRFIGDRNIKTKDEASAYVQRIIDNKAISYWVVKLKEQKVPIGIITFIKRDYLDHRDIGFAFLPQYAGQGYALEAAFVVLKDLIRDEEIILATTVKDNSASIKLLKKLGFIFEKDINHDGTELNLYKITNDKVELDELVKAFFGIFNNINHHEPDWNLLHRICIKETIIIKKQDDAEMVYDLSSFIEPRKQLLSGGTLEDFEEHEINEVTTIAGQIAQRFSVYGKSGRLNGANFKEQGKKIFQFVKTAHGWKICCVIWEDDKN